MSRTFHHGERRIRVRAIRRKQPDIQRLGRALVELALEQAAAELEAKRAHAASAATKQRRATKQPGKEPD